MRAKKEDAYLFQSGDTDRFKIGEGDTFARLSALQTGNPDDLSIVMILPGGKPLETYLHAVFKAESRWVRGEWFIFPDRITAVTLVFTAAEKYRELKAKNPGARPDFLTKLAALSIAA